MHACVSPLVNVSTPKTHSAGVESSFFPFSEREGERKRREGGREGENKRNIPRVLFFQDIGRNSRHFHTKQKAIHISLTSFFSRHIY
jgi:hypothetical protein